VSTYGAREPANAPTRELRHLTHAGVVPLTYKSKDNDDDSLEVLREAAEREGYEAGYAKGLAEANREAALRREDDAARVEAMIEVLSSAVAGAKETAATVRVEIERAAPKLAFQLLEQLLAREVELASDPGIEAITRVLASDQSTQPAIIRMNPLDVEALGDVTSMSLGRDVTFVADSSIETGGAVLEIGKATLDAQLGAALERVRHVLTGNKRSGVSGDFAA
jgi:flagellar assembly protein FliH